MKETFWSKLRELWAIRRRCKEIEMQQRRMRSQEFSGETERRAKIVLPERHSLRPIAESA